MRCGMKVLLINGSPKKDGNTAIALNEMVQVFEKEGIETEIIHIGNKDIRGCIACGKCREIGHCVFNDIVSETSEKCSIVAIQITGLGYACVKIDKKYLEP